MVALPMDAIVEHSRKLIEKGSKSFAGAARLFDEETRASAYMLYAWCRHCDDEIDGQELGFPLANAPVTTPNERLIALTQRTLAAINGKPLPGDDQPVFEAQNSRTPSAGTDRRFSHGR
jgi:15-cis-phytoene synthase